MKKILLIEDDLPLQKKIKMILEMSEYQVVTTDNGTDAIALGKSENPDIIISDIMLPDIDGYQVLEKLHQSDESAGIPFIFLTAKADMADLRKGMNLGADDYLTKPFQKEELLKAIEARLERHNAIKQEISELQDSNEKRYEPEDTILLNQNGEIYSLEISEIECILAEDYYSKVIDKKGTSFLIRKLVKEWEEKLPNKLFIRIHRSTLINFKRIKKIEKSKNSYVIRMKTYPELLTVSRQYAPIIRNMIIS